MGRRASIHRRLEPACGRDPDGCPATEPVGGATISSSTNSLNVKVAPAGNITVQGLDGLESPAVSITMSGLGTAIQMLAPGFGHMGNINVNAKTLNLTDGAAISAGTSIDTGTAGDVILVADSIGVSGLSCSRPSVRCTCRSGEHHGLISWPWTRVRS